MLSVFVMNHSPDSGYSKHGTNNTYLIMHRCIACCLQVGCMVSQEVKCHFPANLIYSVVWHRFGIRVTVGEIERIVVHKCVKTTSKSVAAPREIMQCNAGSERTARCLRMM